jgi:glycosyltransferase involved in cell wall biosynthesis
MSELEFSVVIPIIPKHYKYVKQLISEISRVDAIIKEVILSASSQSSRDESKLIALISQTPLARKIIVLASSKYQSAGENRNLGFQRATAKYVAFLDADDSYKNNRLSVLSYYFDNLSADLILHDYYRFKPNLILNQQLIKSQVTVAHSVELIRATFPDGVRNRKLELGIKGDTNVILPPILSKKNRVHHGHLTVRRENGILYSSRFPGEDGEYARTMLELGRNVVYLNSKLSNYDRFSFSNILSSCVKSIHTFLARKKNYFFLSLRN